MYGSLSDLHFLFTTDSFYEGEAVCYNPETTPGTFNNIVEMLSEKYGPPTNTSSSHKDNKRCRFPDEHVSESAFWRLVDNKFSDTYTIYGMSYNHTKVQYVVEVDYRAYSLEGRFGKKNY